MLSFPDKSNLCSRLLAPDSTSFICLNCKKLFNAVNARNALRILTISAPRFSINSLDTAEFWLGSPSWTNSLSSWVDAQVKSFRKTIVLHFSKFWTTYWFALFTHHNHSFIRFGHHKFCLCWSLLLAFGGTSITKSFVGSLPVKQTSGPLG